MSKKQRLKVPGKDLLETVKQLVRHGDARKICLMDEEKRLLEVPLTVGDPASPATALEAPVIAAIKAFSTMVSECTVEVEKADEKTSG